jgi:hypothetical protein
MRDFHSMLLVALGLRYSTVPVSQIKTLEVAMGKDKQRAISILLFFGTILVLVATWDFPENPSPQVK